jgi:hypothetical protein
MLERPLRQLDLDEIIQGCRIEAGQPRSQEQGYCFELFRRAVEEQEQSAWLAIDEQYRYLIHQWLYDCSPGLPRRAVEEIAPETWPRFWQALTRSGVPLSDRFAHVGAILKYLKQCTISVFREYERRIRRREQIRQRLDSEGGQTLSAQTVTEEELLTRIDQERLLQRVQEWIRTCVTDKQEQRVLSLSYEHGLTPTEITERYPQEFPDAQTVRRLKERILKRARRALRDGYQHRLNGRNGYSQSGKMALYGASDVVRSHERNEPVNS